jgi:hypothetical protein
MQWYPKLGIGETLVWMGDWYQAHAAGEDMVRFSEQQIGRYESLPAMPA